MVSCKEYRYDAGHLETRPAGERKSETTTGINTSEHEIKREYAVLSG